MWRVHRWMLVVALCLAAGVAAGGDASDARLQEAQAAFDEATKLLQLGQLSDAVSKGSHALALREAALGSAHLDVAVSLKMLGELYRLQGDPARAEPLLLRALRIREAALGKHDPDVATSLDD